MSAEIILASGLLATTFAKEVVVVTTTSIYSLIIGIISHEYKNISDTLEEMDIYSQIKIINSFITNIDEKNMKGHDALQLAVNDVYNCVLNIHKELEYINEKCESHKKSWFYYLYKLDCSKELKNLDKHYKVLSKRFDLLIKIFPIIRC